ncbi:hypothetical protein BDV39DRAFT_189802 [Aspergillus sergii]|uniref:Uncharacterized protein n=1 Tax=Aspergillus sergii TaxID=1034303 RepID=A0A5N6XGZ9_9EURO|nr:hypothetical protein BDV39DRAFT_189802 [Aspergillus sergii]
MRILDLPNQPNVVSEKSGGYFFLPAVQRQRGLRLLEKNYTEWNENEKDALRSQLDQCSATFHEFVRRAEGAGKTMVVKEHVPHLIEPIAKTQHVHRSQGSIGSPQGFDHQTLLPDEFLLTWFPTFLVRHPALAFPSELASVMTLRWTRQLFDWYVNIWNQLSAKNITRPKPIVLDADDILANPQIVVRFCDLVGLDSTKLCFSWEPLRSDELRQTDPLKQKMNATLLASSGIMQDKSAQNLNLDCEMEKWKAEFGETEALKLTKWVDNAIPDYEYLRSHRLV